MTGFGGARAGVGGVGVSEGVPKPLVKQNWALSPSGAELAHSVDLSRIPGKQNCIVPRRWKPVSPG